MKNNLILLMVAILLSGISLSAFSQKKPTAKKEIGIQLYSVRERIGSHDKADATKNPDYAKMLRTIAEMGYTSVEAAGYNSGKFYGLTPQEFKKGIESAGLKALSSHVMRPLTPTELENADFSEALKWWDVVIADHKAAGMSYIVTPWLDLPKTVKDLDTYCKYFNEIGKRCRESGILYGYHNHTQEFEKVEGKEVMLDYMLTHTSPENVFFELDVYWVIIAKNSPVTYFKKYPGRFKTLHIKDQSEIGQSGMVGFDAIFKHAELAGVKDIFVEIEGYKTATLEESMKQSVDYLLQAPFVKNTYK